MKHRTCKSFVLLSLLLCAVLALAACGGGAAPASTPPSSVAPASSAPASSEVPDETPAGSGEVSVYTAYTEDEARGLFDLFEQETGIKVRMVQMPAGEIYARVQAESSNPQVSCWFGTPVHTLTTAGREGYLEPYTSANLADIPEARHDSENFWTPHSVSLVTIITNKDWLAENGLEAPKTWDDLLDPAYQGQVVLAHPATSGMSYSWLISVVERFGEEEGFKYMKELDKNVFQYSKSGAAPARMVGMGEAGAAFSFSLDAMQSITAGYPIEVSYPEDGTGSDLTGIALIKDGPADQMENAKKLIDWAITHDAQHYMVNEHYRLPVRDDVEFPEGVTSFSELNLMPLDSAFAVDNRDRLLSKFESEIRGQDSLA